MKDLFALLKQLSHKQNTKRISHFFTLDEAVAALPWVRSHLETAYKELDELYDNLMLTKRMYGLHYADRLEGQDEQEKLLETKMNAFESAMDAWVKRFEEKGYFLKDIQEGIVEFPYKTQDGDILFLCWQLDEEGILYFREPDEVFQFRRPISFLPD